ncbi:hypothetical protein GCM10007362_35950 [Saccharibacillus endophyticus]|uniref:Uncharacterized protein n=1 Tax=Saccharibacillus endophyticus TaxID=2060666 RepID=A0ABQ2A0I9_9BACL|nr:hypothetical protein GCM10007362_35950 [Saccharibacillus endophyticus]
MILKISIIDVLHTFYDFERLIFKNDDETSAFPKKVQGMSLGRECNTVGELADGGCARVMIVGRVLAYPFLHKRIEIRRRNNSRSCSIYKY